MQPIALVQDAVFQAQQGDCVELMIVSAAMFPNVKKGSPLGTSWHGAQEGYRLSCRV